MLPGSLSASQRFKAIQVINSRAPKSFEHLKDERGRALRISEYFGINTFGVHQMKDRLPKDVYQTLISTMETGKRLDPQIAGTVAHAIKEWALSKGATHFCHWFQPLTGSTAEKHDAFLTFDEAMRPIEKFSGAQLIQSEPDASSFPSGGMRTTFEARGYTAWDPSSPVFLIESGNSKTLCIPSAFISYHGDALDEKTSLLRSMEVLSEAASSLLSTLGFKGVERIVPTLGVEQEYFLIDREFYSLRPDLIMTGRTLVGGQPPKGQQLEDHYFGSIPARVLAFMNEAEFELFRLGIPIKTRHNEVAPSQFETAPIFEEVNVATDHNQLVMEVLKKVALRHGFSVLLHEKPFAGVNGSGKHNNWSLMISKGFGAEGENLLDPGKTPQSNLRFLMILVGVLKGVHKHAGLLRASIASSGNDHRLGANEAPPAIISVFLGEMLSRILDEIESGQTSVKGGDSDILKLGLSRLPEIMKDNTDRNRTSPFAFTGNKFEFRAVGSSASPAFPNTLLNSAVADGIAEVNLQLKEKLKSAVNPGVRELTEAAFEVIKQAVKETKAIRFEGNNYSEEWVKEAEKRGLLNLRKTPEALAQLITSNSKEMLLRWKIFSEAELNSRFHVRVERFIKNLLIEADTMKSIVDTMILPAACSYVGLLAQSITSAKVAGVQLSQTDLLGKLSQLINQLHSKRAIFEKSILKAESSVNDEEKAKTLSGEVAQAMAELRSICDELESVVADDFWPLPKYREMLFIS